MGADMTDNTKPEEETREQRLNGMRREFRKTESLWLACCGLSLIATFAYLFLIYKMNLLAGSPLKYIFIVVLLLVVFFCIYFLPIFLKKNKKYKVYSTEYKKAFIKPLLEEAFGEGTYTGTEKMSLDGITDFSLLRKAKGAMANDCVNGVYDQVPFLRYDLTLRYDKKSATTDCVLIATDIKTHLKDELQIIHDKFKISGADYDHPEGYGKVSSGKDSFDKKFSVYAKDVKEGERFAKKLNYSKLEKLARKDPIAVFFDKKKVYLVIKRDKDVMEAPVYHSVKEERCIKEAKEEVDIIKSWIDFLKDCV
jgi:hypothetical protein